MIVPAQVAGYCGSIPERAAWLARLPALLRELESRWALRVGDPYDGDDVSSGWVAPATRADGTPAVLKMLMPKMENEQQIDGLRIWNGDGVVRLLEVDEQRAAMLMERCEPGTPLRELPEEEQDVVVAGLLRRLWRAPGTGFRPLSARMETSRVETLADRPRWPDAGLVEAGLRLFEELPRTATSEVLLATDLHAANVLRASREPWLAIDPEPFVGEPAYDATQHLFNCRARMRADPRGMVRRMADLLQVDEERIRLWAFARAAAEPRENWDGGLFEIARRLAG